MLKKILSAALLMPLLALAQTYPSPTFNNVTSQGTATLNNATVSGTFTATGKVGLGSLASQAANTVVANATGSSASPTAIAAPSCSTSSSALSWTSGTGLGCNTSINAATLGGATFAAPGAIGGTTPGSGAFTTLSASSTVSGTGFSSYLASPPSIGSTTPGSGAFTTLTATTPVGAASGGTGRSTLTAHGVLVGEGTAAINQLAVGTTGQVLVGSTGADPAFGSSVGALTFTGAITPSSTAGIIGTTTNDNANAGSIGEVLSNSTTGTSLTNNTAANVTSVSLTAGDWDVQCSVQYNPAGGTSMTGFQLGVSTTSATIGAFGTFFRQNASFSTGAAQTFQSPVVRISVSATTTVYAVAIAAFGGSTMTGDGIIRARRVR